MSLHKVKTPFRPKTKKQKKKINHPKINWFKFRNTDSVVISPLTGSDRCPSMSRMEK